MNRANILKFFNRRREPQFFQFRVHKSVVLYDFNTFPKMDIFQSGTAERIRANRTDTIRDYYLMQRNIGIKA